MINMQEYNFMRLALEEAEKARDRDEVPVGAVLVNRETGTVIAKNGNRTRELNDPSAHAEMLVIREACRHAGAQRIPEADLYVTLEPCAMCAAAISFARIGNLYYGAYDEKGGAVKHGPAFFQQPVCHHKPSITGGIIEDECSVILKTFFAAKR